MLRDNDAYIQTNIIHMHSDTCHFHVIIIPSFVGRHIIFQEIGSIHALSSLHKRKVAYHYNENSFLFFYSWQQIVSRRVQIGCGKGSHQSYQRWWWWSIKGPEEKGESV